MKINFAAKYLALSMVGGALVSPIAVAQPQTPLDRGQIWARACNNALVNNIKIKHPHAIGIRTFPETEYQYPVSNAETAVTGNARYEGIKGVHELTFTCIYNFRYGAVSGFTYDIYNYDGD